MTDVKVSSSDLMTIHHYRRRMGLPEAVPFPHPWRGELHKLTPGLRADGKPMGWDKFSNFEQMVWYRQRQREGK